MPKRNRAALLLVLPIAVFFWFIGWSLYWMGSRGKALKPGKMPVNGLTFTVLMPEQKYAK
jgi:hypothetical protein